MITKNGFQFDGFISFVRAIRKDTVIKKWEIKPQRQVRDHGKISVLSTERCSPEDATAYALYIRTADNSLEWVIDVPTKEEAEQFRDLIKQIIKAATQAT